MSRDLFDPNFPLSADGKSMHLEVGEGDVNPRILSVGDRGRGERISRFLTDVREIKSKRGFVTFSGNFEGTPVSIIVTGMGIAMMDFVVREASFAVKGKMAVIRLGTCGILKPQTKPGSIIVANSARFIQQNYNYPDGEPFTMSNAVESDPLLLGLLKEKISDAQLDTDDGVDLTCETFYNAQGRVMDIFEDFNEGMIERLFEKESQAAAMEMETFKLLHLAKCSRGKIAASACMIGLLNRQTKEMMDFSRLEFLEGEAGKSALRALINFSLDN